MKSQVGTPVAKLITFSDLDVIFYNITCFLGFWLLFVILCPFLVSEYLVLCDDVVDPTKKKIRRKARNKERKKARKERKNKQEAKKE